MIDTAEALTQLCQELSQHDVIAIDTEFLREKTYYAQLCLIQIATEEHIACVDPLAIGDIQPLLDILYEPSRVVVIHSGRQDLELFFDKVGELPTNIFDTQIAATLLGHGDQVGYAKLVKAMTDVSLDKGQTRTDWSRRPLSDEQIQYALDDVRYLIGMYQAQIKALAEAGRSDWLASDFAALSDKSTYTIPEATLWQRVKGYNTLKGMRLCVLQELAVWREGIAKQKNRPRRWIIKDDLLIELARHLPKTREQVEKMRGMESGIRRYTDTILEIISRASQLPEEQWPSMPKYTPMTIQQEARADSLMAIVKIRAEANNISTNVLTSRKEIEALVLGKEDLSVTKGWRMELVGRDLYEFLEGRSSLLVCDGTISIVSQSK